MSSAHFLKEASNSLSWDGKLLKFASLSLPSTSSYACYILAIVNYLLIFQAQQLLSGLCAFFSFKAVFLAQNTVSFSAHHKSLCFKLQGKWHFYHNDSFAPYSQNTSRLSFCLYLCYKAYWTFACLDGRGYSPAPLMTWTNFTDKFA